MAELFEMWLDEVIEAKTRVRQLEKKTIGDTECVISGDVFNEILIYKGFDEMAKTLNKLVTSEYKEKVKRYRKSFKYKGWEVITYTEVIEDAINQD